jgi:hypothetical protein
MRIISDSGQEFNFNLDNIEDVISMLYEVFPNQYHKVDDIVEFWFKNEMSGVSDYYEDALGNLDGIVDCSRAIRDIIQDGKRHSGRITKEFFQEFCEQILTYSEDITDHTYHTQDDLGEIGKYIEY